MRIVLTGASKISPGYWFAQALAGAGHEVIAPLSSPDRPAPMPEMRGRRVGMLKGLARTRIRGTVRQRCLSLALCARSVPSMCFATTGPRCPRLSRTDLRRRGRASRQYAAPPQACCARTQGCGMWVDGVDRQRLRAERRHRQPSDAGVQPLWVVKRPDRLRCAISIANARECHSTALSFPTRSARTRNLASPII